ncbi:MAG: tetratricopeptide repeat protein [Bacteroidia bacterium]|nr:tetratricopeptide repeat protein [Bacteroidia bacterium]
MLKQIIFLLALSNLLTPYIYGQTAIDSLKRILNNASKEDRPHILNELAEHYITISPKKAEEYIEQAISIAEELKIEQELAGAYTIAGKIYYSCSNYAKALESYKKSLEIHTKSGNEEEIARCYNNIGSVYEIQGQYVQAIDFYKKSAVMKEKLPDKKGLAVTLNNIGNVYAVWGNYNEAIEYYKKSLKISDTKDDKTGMAGSLNSLGIVYLNIGKYEKALDYYKKCLAILEKTENRQNIAVTMNNIGNLYSEWEIYDKAVEYYKKSLSMFEEFGNQYGIATCLNAIGFIYKNHKEYDTAIIYYEKSLKISQTIANKKLEAISLNNMGEISKETGDYQKAIEYYLFSLKIKEAAGNKEGIALTLNNIGRTYSKMENHQVAMEYFFKSLQISKQINLKKTIMTNYSDISDIYYNAGNYHEAITYYKLYSGLKDSLYNIEKATIISQMESRYAIEKKEMEVYALLREKKLKEAELAGKEAELTTQRSIIYIFILVFIIVIILFLFIYIEQKNREIKKRSRLQQKLNEYMQKALSQQMNPHFIFNTLNSIQYFILQNDNLSSNKYLTMFAKLMIITLDNSQKDYIPVKDEIDSLTLYLELEALRFEGKFDYKIIFDKNSDILEHKIPSMLIQPYVENAIRHGIMPKGEKGYIEIELQLNDKIIKCRVEDNGIGRKKADELKKHQPAAHQSLGSKITETRINLINSLYGSDLNIKYEDLRADTGEATGTRVTLDIPLMNYNGCL